MFPVKKKETAAERKRTRVRKHVHAVLVKSTQNGRALNPSEISIKTLLSLVEVQRALEDLEAIGLIYVAGHDKIDQCFASVRPVQGLALKLPYTNPTPGRKAEKKAAAWYQMESLETGAKTIKLPTAVEAVEVGEIVAIEYRSRKYTGRNKVWRHEVTQPRKLHISTDGKVLVVLPGFKITKRGIEG